MDIFFRTEKALVKMKDKVEVERGGYLTTSSLNGQEKYPIVHYDNEKRAIEILDKIDNILDKAIQENANTISIAIPSDKWWITAQKGGNMGRKINKEKAGLTIRFSGRLPRE